MKLSFKQVRLKLGELEFNYHGEIEGGIFGVFGVSGSGKSTLMKLICGIEKADSGSLIFNDTTFFDLKKNIYLSPQKRNVGVVFQEHYLFPHLTVEQNLRFGMRFTKGERISFSEVTALLDLLPLLHKLPAMLSGGERQRAAIGRALLQQPQMLLLDEPFSNLDRKRRHQIISYLIKIHNCFDIPLLIISHDLEDILKLTQSLIIIEKQSIIAAGEYLNIAKQGIMPGLITPKRFTNTINLYHQRYIQEKGVNYFGLFPDGETLLSTNSSYFSEGEQEGRRVKIAIAPDDIALSKEVCKNISMQNQIKGVVTNILQMNDSIYVTIDCGVELISEITTGARHNLNVKIGRELFCLFKAKAVEIIHIYEK